MEFIGRSTNSASFFSAGYKRKKKAQAPTSLSNGSQSHPSSQTSNIQQKHPPRSSIMNLSLIAICVGVLGVACASDENLGGDEGPSAKMERWHQRPTAKEAGLWHIPQPDPKPQVIHTPPILGVCGTECGPSRNVNCKKGLHCSWGACAGTECCPDKMIFRDGTCGHHNPSSTPAYRLSTLVPGGKFPGAIVAGIPLQRVGCGQTCNENAICASGSGDCISGMCVGEACCKNGQVFRGGNCVNHNRPSTPWISRDDNSWDPSTTQAHEFRPGPQIAHVSQDRWAKG